MTKVQHKIFLALLFSIGTFIFFYFLVQGFSYYNTSIEERFFHPSHVILKPSGLIGHGIGIIGSLMMIVGVSSYMIRKRVKRFVRSGSLKHWLEFHIFLCSVGPILVLYHTAFKFGGIVAVSFWSMVAVVISGIIGRFIYVQIPRSIQGNEYSLDEMKILNEDYSIRLKDDYDLDEKILTDLDHLKTDEAYKTLNFLQVIILIMKDYSANRKLIARVKNKFRKNNIPKETIDKVVKLCSSKLVLSRRIVLLHSIQRIFKLWHIVHLPFAIIMLLIMLIHIVVTVTFGYKWIF